MLPEDVPTINAILVDYGINNLLDPADFADLLAELQNREEILRNDAVDHAKYKVAKSIEESLFPN